MDVGDHRSMDQVPIACKDAVAILFMFDLTSRCTLNRYVNFASPLITLFNELRVGLIM